MRAVKTFAMLPVCAMPVQVNADEQKSGILVQDVASLSSLAQQDLLLMEIRDRVPEICENQARGYQIQLQILSALQQTHPPVRQDAEAR